MKVNVVVNCQYFENYNVGTDGFNTFGDKQPHWKPKGGHTFTMPIDSDTVTYTEPSELVDVFVLLLKNKTMFNLVFSTLTMKFNGVSFDVIEGLQEEIEKSVLV